MDNTSVYDLLKKVSEKEMSVEEAALILKKEPFEDIGFAKVDTHRKLRQGYLWCRQEP